MFLFNVYMYVIYISTCIDIINSVYLLLYLIMVWLLWQSPLQCLALVLMHFASRRLLVNQAGKVNNKKQQPPPSWWYQV